MEIAISLNHYVDVFPKTQQLHIDARNQRIGDASYTNQA
jgi:hypothetical protein